MLRLSNNFRLGELVKSQTALRLNISNVPTEQVIESLQLLVLRVLQPAREYFDKSMTVSSGYRSPELNAKLGGAERSQHVKGEAADIEIHGVDNHALACWIRDNLEFDQLVLEYYNGEPNSGWVHVSYKENRNRQECLTVSTNSTAIGINK